ncbi:MAG: YgaP-like transmembrane domain, partial [Lacibacter sp.]
GFSYSFFRNIGWQDRTIRTIAGIVATIGAFYFLKTNAVAAIALAALAVAQFWTVLSARCIVCFFMGQCTISRSEKNKLLTKGIDFEK